MNQRSQDLTVGDSQTPDFLCTATTVATPGVCLGIKLTVRLDLDNEPQPDLVLYLEESIGGETNITADDFTNYFQILPVSSTLEKILANASPPSYCAKRVLCRGFPVLAVPYLEIIADRRDRLIPVALNGWQNYRHSAVTSCNNKIGVVGFD